MTKTLNINTVLYGPNHLELNQWYEWGNILYIAVDYNDEEKEREVMSTRPGKLQVIERKNPGREFPSFVKTFKPYKVYVIHG